MSVKNIIGLYTQATLDDLREGMSWYEDANSFCKGISEEFNFPLPKVAAVVSHLSPRNRWSRNKKDVVSLFKAYRDKKDLHQVKVATFNTNRSKAVAVIKGETQDWQPHGPKTRAFFKNILGCSDLVTVDTHAYSIAKGKRIVNKAINKSEYKRIEECYKTAASMLGIQPYQLQACTWVTFRRLNNI